MPIQFSMSEQIATPSKPPLTLVTLVDVLVRNLVVATFCVCRDIASGAGMVALFTVNDLVDLGFYLCLVLLTRSSIQFQPLFWVFGSPSSVCRIDLRAVCDSLGARIFCACGFYRLSFTTLGVVAAGLEIYLPVVGVIVVQ
jgi:hypothetical protein